MYFTWLDAIVNLIEQDTVKGLILLAILLVVFFILVVLAVFLYKKNYLLQRIINLLPFIKKEFVMIANFSKKEGKINDIKKNYLKSGCKVFELDTHKHFEKDGTISKEKLEEVVEKQQDTIKNAKKIMKSKNSFVYIGFPHVPLGFLDGANFSDIDDPILYEYQGIDYECLEKGFFELKRINNTELQLVQNIAKTETLGKEIALKIEQSFTINDDEINKAISVSSIIFLSPKNTGRWKITNYAQINKYQREFENLLSELKRRGVEKIHLFATTPVSLSFSLGRVINHYYPEVIVYNYNNGIFDWGINLRTYEIVCVD